MIGLVARPLAAALSHVLHRACLPSLSKGRLYVAVSALRLIAKRAVIIPIFLVVVIAIWPTLLCHGPDFNGANRKLRDTEISSFPFWQGPHDYSRRAPFIASLSSDRELQSNYLTARGLACALGL
jgi:hypothetical protein